MLFVLLLGAFILTSVWHIKKKKKKEEEELLLGIKPTVQKRRPEF